MFVTMNRSDRLAKIVEAEGHKGEGLCSTRGDIWPHTGHRTLLSVTNYPIQKKKTWKNTSGWGSLHRWWIVFTNILRTMVEMKQMSVKDRLQRKKHIGVQKWKSEPMVRMINRFPMMQTKQINRNSPNRSGWISSSFESHKRMKFEVAVKFSGFR